VSDFVEHNRRAWNEVHRRRHEAYGPSVGLRDDALALLEPLAGARVLHLQCATGETSAQLAARGADVVGVDVSDEAIAVARETVPGARFVVADVHALPDLGAFDLVVTEGGVLVWLHDLAAWADGIAAALRPGGRFLLSEEHPVAMCVDAELRWVEDYFDESVFTESGWDHFELTGPAATETKHERFWRLGQVVTALAQAGLRIEQLVELPGGWRGTDRRVPGRMLLVATKF
jgi:SAM-dependent methyltransferase